MKKKGHYLYETWCSMRQRCNNENYRGFHFYGGRGIKICKEWDDFWVFVDDMGDRPEGHTLDRKDNDKGYSKENCRWATPVEQIQNRRPFVITGSKGFYKTASGKYRAEIKVENEKHYLGQFACPLMAHLAYKDAAEKKLRGEPVK